MGWGEFILAFGAFFLCHSIPVRPPVRGWLSRRLGETGFTLAYSALSLGLLGWVIGAAGRAPHVPLWTWAPWQAHVTLAAMLAVCVIACLAVGRPNPFSFGGRDNDRFDPDRPGIVRYARHPLLVALALWALAHLLPNGDLAHVLLFGCFGAFALAGGRLIDRRRKRQMGARWQDLTSRLSSAPLVPRPRSWRGAFLRAGAGIVLYALLLAAHPHLFGVSPLG